MITITTKVISVVVVVTDRCVDIIKTIRIMMITIKQLLIPIPLSEIIDIMARQ